jgi:type III pantothenate kinase
MLLCIDIGNSRTKLALYENGQRVHVHQYRTPRRERPTDFDNAALGGILETPFFGAPVDQIAISGVVPELHGLVARGYRKLYGVQPKFVGKQLLPPFPVRYDSPESVGADRLANIAAALALYPPPVIVVDCGTAINIDVAAADGAFIGGAILPGPEAVRDALYRAAPHLPRVEVRAPERVIGGSSRECLQSGFYYGLLSELEGLVGRVRAELGGEAPVIGTGGWAEALLQGQPWVERVEPLLTVEGVYRIWSASNS